MDDKVYTQRSRSGICNGYRVAPVLSHIFLSSMNRASSADVDGLVLRVLSYVDDYMILLKLSDITSKMDDILKCLRKTGQGLEFLCEVPVNRKVQFLLLVPFVQR